MDTINNDLTNLLQQMGVHKESLGITQRIVIIAGILIIAFVADYFCRKIVVPTIKKLTARTQATWDDYLFNDAVLDVSSYSTYYIVCIASFCFSA